MRPEQRIGNDFSADMGDALTSTTLKPSAIEKATVTREDPAVNSTMSSQDRTAAILEAMRKQKELAPAIKKIEEGQTIEAVKQALMTEDHGVESVRLTVKASETMYKTTTVAGDSLKDYVHKVASSTPSLYVFATEKPSDKEPNKIDLADAILNGTRKVTYFSQYTVRNMPPDYKLLGVYNGAAYIPAQLLSHGFTPSTWRTIYNY